MKYYAVFDTSVRAIGSPHHLDSVSGDGESPFGLLWP